MKGLIDWNSLAKKIMLALVFLLPLVFFPSIFSGFDFSKTAVFYALSSLVFIFWLIDLLYKGEIELPKNILIVSSIGIIIAWAVSTLFSQNKFLSFAGYGGEIDTFVSIFYLGAIFLIASVFFQSDKNVLNFFSLVFLSSIIVFIFQVAKLIVVKFGLPLPDWEWLNSPDFNLIGDWKSFSIYFGFIALVSSGLFDCFKKQKFYFIISFFALVFSLIALCAVNFVDVLMVLCFFIFLMFVYLLSARYLQANEGAEEARGGNFLNIAFFVLLIILFLILGRNLINDKLSFLNINVVEINPSWSSTYDVAKESLKGNFLTGSGPNTFLYDWMKFKPDSLSATVFNDMRFNFGVGSVPSFVITAGLLGIVSWLFFLLSFVFIGWKVLAYNQNNLLKSLIGSLFLGTLYLWVFVIIFSPPIIIFFLAYIMTGATVGMLVKAKKIKIIKINLFDNPRKSFFFTLIIALLIIFFSANSYVLFQKYWSDHLLVRSLSSLNKGDRDAAEAVLSSAIRFNGQDRYYRLMADFGLIKSQSILFDRELSQETKQAQFRAAYSSSLNNSQKATEINPLDSLNWIKLAQVYESIISLNVAGADEMAIKFYIEAADRSPKDFKLLFKIGSLYYGRKNYDEAIKYFEQVKKLNPQDENIVDILNKLRAESGL